MNANYLGPVELIVFPYRDMYFANKFGWSVRDLAVIRALQSAPEVRNMIIVNRPVSVYERLLGKSRSKYVRLPTAEVVDNTAFDCVGPIQGRAWTRLAYSRYVPSIRVKEPGVRRVILDFTPIADVDYDRYGADLVWYDMIDNFAKHNRFNERERSLVRAKYGRVKGRADLITGVTQKALEELQGGTCLLLPNGMMQSAEPLDEGPARFDFGFMGFVTSKFDVELVRLLATEGNYSIAVHGEIYDRTLAKELRSIKNVTLGGAFNAAATEEIISAFDVGLIPYKAELSHDGSPLKLYQYLARGRQVLSSHAYAGETDRYREWVTIAEGMSAGELLAAASSMLIRAKQGGVALKQSISRSLTGDVFWPEKITKVLNVLLQPCQARLS